MELNIPPIGVAIDAWLDAMPDDPYAKCPCGCGKKWRFAIKENPEEHEARFIANYMADHPQEVKESSIFDILYTELDHNKSNA